MKVSVAKENSINEKIAKLVEEYTGLKCKTKKTLSGKPLDICIDVCFPNGNVFFQIWHSTSGKDRICVSPVLNFSEPMEKILKKVGYKKIEVRGV